MKSRVCMLIALSCLAGPATRAAAEVDLAAATASLDSDRFDERERAEADLIQGGRMLIGQVLSPVAIPPTANDAQVERLLKSSADALQRALQEQLYSPLDRHTSLEARFRAARVREIIQKEAARRLALAQAAFPNRLPPAEAEKVYGNTGGFRDGTTWFDAEFRNGTQYTVTSIRILVRLTHKGTKVQREKEVQFDAPDVLLRPGESARLSVDVGMAHGPGKEFFWKTTSVFGRAPMPSEPAAPALPTDPVDPAAIDDLPVDRTLVPIVP